MLAASEYTCALERFGPLEEDIMANMSKRGSAKQLRKLMYIILNCSSLCTLGKT